MPVSPLPLPSWFPSPCPSFVPLHWSHLPAVGDSPEATLPGSAVQSMHCRKRQFAPHVGNLAGQLSSSGLEEWMVAWQGGCPCDFSLCQPLNHSMHFLAAFSPGSKDPSPYPAKTVQPGLHWPNLARRLRGTSLSRGRARNATVHPIYLSGCCTVVCSEPICPPLH